ncbi:MAG: HEAT repeat domain-containing protein [Bacteroidota bacterium]
MKNILPHIKKLIGLQSEQKCGAYTIDEWHVHFRRKRKLDRDQLLEGIQEALALENAPALADIPKLYVQSQLPFVLCLCACVFSLEKETLSTPIIDKLISSLLHSDESVRRFSAIALTEINEVRTLAAVVAGHSHGHGIRTEAAWKLKEFGPEAQEAIPSLISLLEYQNINWRSHYAASEALSSIGEAAKGRLWKQLDSPLKFVRYYCASALDQMGLSELERKKIETILENDA